jgi:hypothetical protein
MDFTRVTRVEYAGCAGEVYEGDAMDRREFLQGGALAFATVALSPWLIAGTSTTGGGALGKADFEALLHTWFHVGSPESGWQSVELVAVRDDGSNARVEQFSAVFRGAAGMELPEGLHTLVPQDGDELALFLQPTGGDAAGATFAARFSRLRLVPAACASA